MVGNFLASHTRGRRGCDRKSNYLCNQCLSPQTLWVWNPLMARCTWYNIMW